MKVYNEKHNDLTKVLNITLEEVRKIRNFNVKNYIEAKTKLLNQYITKSKLDTCLIAVSGGIDSAITLALVNKAKNQKDSTIKNIVAVTIPSFDGSVTNQNQTIEKAKELCDSLNIKLNVLDITPSCITLSQDIEKILGKKEIDYWARGQLVSYVRTPSLYYFTSVLNSQGARPILVGTINRDEGAYLGYMCKSGDAMVDVQLISDLHKSEIYKVAKELNIPKVILDAKPNGDMFDGRVDEEVFGAPYDFVELYLNYKVLTKNTWKALTKNWNKSDQFTFDKYANALEKLHSYNAHKYSGGSSALHLDVLNSSVPGGWIEGIHSGLNKDIYMNAPIQTHRFVGFVNNSPNLNVSLETEVKTVTVDYKLLNSLLTKEEITIIKEWVKVNEEKMIKTNQYGFINNMEKTGSSRLSFYDEDWAKIIFERIMYSGALENVKIFNENDDTNWRPYSMWKAIGVNPMIRVLNYNEGDVLYPHYDDSYYKNNSQRSLVTLVINIENAEEGGATRFIKDEQATKPFQERNFNDLESLANGESIKESIKLSPGNAIMFDHRKLHDGEKVKKGNKVVLRTDIMYEKCSFY